MPLSGSVRQRRRSGQTVTLVVEPWASRHVAIRSSPPRGRLRTFNFCSRLPAPTRTHRRPHAHTQALTHAAPGGHTSASLRAGGPLQTSQPNQSGRSSGCGCSAACCSLPACCSCAACCSLPASRTSGSSQSCLAVLQQLAPHVRHSTRRGLRHSSNGQATSHDVFPLGPSVHMRHAVCACCVVVALRCHRTAGFPDHGASVPPENQHHALLLPDSPQPPGNLTQV